MKKIIGAALLTACLTAANAQASGCGKVSIAEMNWSSAALMAHVDAFILRHGYGCDTEVISGDTVPTGTSMVEKGQPDIAPEFWISNFKEAIDKGVSDKRLRVAGDALSDGGEEGFWVPEYLVKKDPSLATIEGIKANAKMFPNPEDPDRSAFMTCPSGWGCQIANDNLYVALGLEAAGFDLVDPGTGAALAGAIAKAYERQEPWFGYYWAPTPILGKYKMVKVDFGHGFDREHFTGCIATTECADPKPTMYPPSPVKTVVVEAFAGRAPDAYQYLSKRSFTNNTMNELLAWADDNQADGEVAMENFLKNYEQVWSKWLPADVTAKVKKGLAEL